MSRAKAGPAFRLDGTRQERIVEIAAWSLWAVLLVAVSVLVVLHPGRSIFDVYRDGVNHWWASQALYNHTMRGFVYLTTSPLIFTPFVLLGAPADDLVWRFFSVALFLYGLWRLVLLTAPGQPRLVMAAILLLLLPVAAVNVQRGQAEVAMMGWMFLGVADAAEGHWRRSALWLCLAFALKPLAFVLILLYGVLIRPLRLPLLAGVATVLVLPFLHPDPAYVATQEIAMWRELTAATQPGLSRFNKLAMMLRHFSIDLSPAAIMSLRVAGALFTLGFAAIVVRCRSPRKSAIDILALAVCYLVIFNPRTELGSYMNLGAVVGLYAAAAWYDDRDRRGTALLLALLILGLGTQAYGDWIYRPTDVWLKPALAIVFYGYLARRILTQTNPRLA